MIPNNLQHKQQIFKLRLTTKFSYIIISVTQYGSNSKHYCSYINKLSIYPKKSMSWSSKSLAQCHTVWKCWNWLWNQVCFNSETKFLTTVLYLFSFIHSGTLPKSSVGPNSCYSISSNWSNQLMKFKWSSLRQLWELLKSQHDVFK